MTSAQALRGVASKMFFFFLTAAAFIFISILVIGIHP
jgi:hypothetical protein